MTSNNIFLYISFSPNSSINDNIDECISSIFSLLLNMAIVFTDYAKVKNKICLFLLGDDKVSLDKALNIIKILEKKYLDLNIFICVDDYRHINHEKIIKYSDFKKTDFAFTDHLYKYFTMD